MTRYRIKQVGSLFYPQKRMMWFWWEPCVRWRIGRGAEDIWYRTLEEAQAYLVERVNHEARRAVKPVVQIHPFNP